MIKRIVILLLGFCISYLMRFYQIMNADMAFVLVLGIGFFIMATWTCFHASVPDKDKSRLFLKLIVHLFLVYMILAGISYVVSLIVHCDFWYIFIFYMGFYVIFGKYTIKYDKQVSPDVSHHYETSIDGSSRREITRYEKCFEGSAEGLKSFEEFISEIKNGSLKEDKSFEQFMREIKADSSMEDLDFEEIFRKLFD